MLSSSSACERNKGPILDVLKGIFVKGKVLEIGSATAQHAEYFSKHLPVSWQTSDLPYFHDHILERKKKNNAAYLDPIELVVSDQSTIFEQVKDTFEGVFNANTLHIMPEACSVIFAKQIHEVMAKSSDLVLYGPFAFSDIPMSATNVEFDKSLKNGSPRVNPWSLPASRDYSFIRS